MEIKEAAEKYRARMECNKRWYTNNADECWDTDCETAKCPYYVSREKEAEMNAVVLFALEKLERNCWTPCREKLPEAGQRVLVQQKDGEIAVRRCIDQGHLAWFYANTIAWMPAPEPYQERLS